MDELINVVANKVGVDEEVAKKAVGAILNFLKQQQLSMDNVDWGKIMEKLQGAAELMSKPEAERAVSERPIVGPTVDANGETISTPTSTGTPGGYVAIIFTLLKALGIIAMLKQFLQPIFGDGAVKLIDSFEDGAELTGVLQSLNINRDSGIMIVKLVVDFMKSKLDSETIDTLVNQIPAVKAFLGDLKKEE